MESLSGLGLFGPVKIPETTTTAQPSSRQLPAYITTVADYTFGGAAAGIASSFGRRRGTRRNVMNGTSRGIAATRGRPPVIGVLTGIGLGFVAGCDQAAVDCGVKFAKSQRDYDHR